MKKIVFTSLFLLALFSGYSQSLVGTWQLSDEKTCFQAEMKESDTERELRDAMGASRNAVARLIKFSAKGTGEEGVFSTGKKKGSGMTPFNYRMSGEELQFIDKKSGIATQRFIIDELSASTLRLHNALKDCETKTFIRVK